MLRAGRVGLLVRSTTAPVLRTVPSPRTARDVGGTRTPERSVLLQVRPVLPWGCLVVLGGCLLRGPVPTTAPVPT